MRRHNLVIISFLVFVLPATSACSPGKGDRYDPSLGPRHVGSLQIDVVVDPTIVLDSGSSKLEQISQEVEIFFGESDFPRRTHVDLLSISNLGRNSYRSWKSTVFSGTDHERRAREDFAGIASELSSSITEILASKNGSSNVSSLRSCLLTSLIYVADARRESKADERMLLLISDLLEACPDQSSLLGPGINLERNLQGLRDLDFEQVQDPLSVYQRVHILYIPNQDLVPPASERAFLNDWKTTLTRLGAQNVGNVISTRLAAY